MTKKIRVRFAPAPTGFMHIGNARTALMNYLFAKKHNGTFVLRVEDTDPNRIIDQGGAQIIADLAWLGIQYDEGGALSGPYEPYFQSKRAAIYQMYLEKLIEQKQAYPCFCSPETLEKKRLQQVAFKLPPRYDKSCLLLSDEERNQKHIAETPFIWRYTIDPRESVTINDLSRGAITFELRNFSDIPLTRTDGSFTFLFANAVDDMLMEITHVFRGEDHLSNSATQAALITAFDKTPPLYWHMPIICSVDGKKLSKRNFGFSIKDLQQGGYLPEAILNYLALLGEGMVDTITPLDQLASVINLDTPKSSGSVTYSTEQLQWFNRRWITTLPHEKLVQHTQQFLQKHAPDFSTLSNEECSDILAIVKSELVTLEDFINLLTIKYQQPVVNPVLIQEIQQTISEPLEALIDEVIQHLPTPKTLTHTLRTWAQQHNAPLPQLFMLIRLALSGKQNGPSLQSLISLIGVKNAQKRIADLKKIFIS